jgi:ABC-type amino acid transport substrate-binding protein
MVKNDSGIESAEGLNKKSIGVVSLTTTRAFLISSLPENDMNFKEYGSLAEAKKALDLGIVDAIALADHLLRGYLDDTTNILTDMHSPLPQGIATRLENKMLSKSVEDLINKWLDDGTIDRLKQKYNNI